MFSIGLTMKLKPGALKGYVEAHDNLWPEIAASMSDNDVNMVIFRREDRLFLVATAPSKAHWDRSREAPILNKWDREMTRYLEADTQGNIAFERLEPVFTFGEFAGA